MPLSVNIKAIQARIRRLPKLLDDYVDAARKKDAEAVLKEFQDSIENGKIKPKLARRTIKQKKRLGYSKPYYPLRGLGMEAAHTYARSMRIYKIKNGWRVRMPAVKHHKSKLTLDALFQIHEKGCTISGKNGTIVIPARPALERAYKKIMRNISKGEVAEVKRAVTKYLKTGAVPKNG